ncbi:unnamed protein product [Acanthoscelides obtectus]|uniref:PiggyBac transposable element-derived protein domain-containing protein n=1 Tax=Acanthoscelides obtectus TaxID=200917 RepID=A0A9P0PKR7_ACAOB|nr:unnamed protein product [Acanthoscelides obtectus]CAK1663259.1 PiggyBac transposable element-derived protein 4 [Acanthoscelides obtectus]
MNVQDYYTDSDDDSEYKLSDNSDMSDSDETYSETDDEELVENVTMDEWQVLSEPFSDQVPRATQNFSSEYTFHPAIDMEECRDPVNCFECFLSPNIVAKLSEWTNRRAEMYFEQNTNTRTVYGVQWKKLEKEEMYVFIALHILTGLVKCPRITDYWSNNILCAGPKVFNKSLMSRNRYLSILKFIRFSPPEAARNNAPLSRLGIYMSMLKDNCKTLVDPGPVFAIDEHLMLYKGRLHFRQYIKTKRNRFGIKLFAMCPSAPHLRGYTWNLCLYVGKDNFDVSHIPGTGNLTVSERIVVHLAQNILNSGREVILDNWYTSVRLSQFLLTQGTYLTGTIRSNRGVPAQLTRIPLGNCLYDIRTRRMFTC